MRTLGLVAVAVLLSACTTVGTGTGNNSAATAQGMQVTDGWYPGERLFPSRTERVAALSMPAYRRGTTPDGLTYTIYPDGSGGVKAAHHGAAQGWSIDCSKDAMTDRRVCTLTSYAARLLVYYGAAVSPQSVCIIGHDFPGRTGAIRVDARAPVSTDRDGCAPANVAAQLATGVSVTTRRVEWPYDYTKDETADISGAEAAMDLVRFIRGNVDRLAF